MLDDLQDLARVIESNPTILTPRYGGTIIASDMYCPKCGDARRMAITPIYSPPMNVHMGLNLADDVPKQLVPSLFSFACVQCDTRFTAVVFQGPDGPSLAVLPSCRGGLTTPNTPPGVAFYLDQAQKAQSVGANSAAVAMFRGALEHLLFDQDYKAGMLSAKINQLCEDIKKGSAPKWALELETDFLDVIKDLGNASIHPNDGDVNKQAALDSTLLARMKETFLMLLFLVYEAPRKKKEMLNELRAKLRIIKK